MARRNHEQPKANEACPGIPRSRAGRQDIPDWADGDSLRTELLSAGRAADIVRLAETESSVFTTREEGPRRWPSEKSEIVCS